MEKKIFSTMKVWPVNLKVTSRFRIKFSIDWNPLSLPAILDKNGNLSSIIHCHCLHSNNGKKDFFHYESMAG